MRHLIRTVLALAGAMGLIAVTAGPAAAGIAMNHAEPLLDGQRG
jgi:hypothetical protein